MLSVCRLWGPAVVRLSFCSVSHPRRSNIVPLAPGQQHSLNRYTHTHTHTSSYLSGLCLCVNVLFREFREWKDPEQLFGASDSPVFIYFFLPRSIKQHKVSESLKFQSGSVKVTVMHLLCLKKDELTRIKNFFYFFFSFLCLTFHSDRTSGRLIAIIFSLANCKPCSHKVWREL